METFAAGEVAKSLPVPTHAGPNYRRRAYLVILLGTAFHLLYSTHLELVGDEAYYWLWSRHPDFCYLDKGPMTAWLIAASTAIFGQTVFGIRFVAVLLASATGLCLFSLARQMFSARVGFWVLVLGMVIPLFAVGATLMTIDTVYIFFWSWAALSFWHARDELRLLPWIGTGAIVGLGLLSKYTAAFELFSFALFCIWHRPARRHFRAGTFWAMLGTAALFLIPGIVWNVRHHWPTLAWLWHRGDLNRGADLHFIYLLRFLGEQAAVISPLLFLALLLVSLRRARSLAPALPYALSLFLPLLLFYTVMSLHYPGPPNWPAAAYLGGMLLLAAEGPALVRSARLRRLLVSATLVLASLETVALLETRWLHLPPNVDPLDRARGARALARAVDGWAQRTQPDIVLADNYMTASLLSFYLPGQREVSVPHLDHPLNQLEVWSTDQSHSRILIVCKRKKAPPSLRANFRATRLDTIRVQDGKRQVGKYGLFLLEPTSSQDRRSAFPVTSNPMF